MRLYRGFCTEKHLATQSTKRSFHWENDDFIHLFIAVCLCLYQDYDGYVWYCSPTFSLQTLYKQNNSMSFTKTCCSRWFPKEHNYNVVVFALDRALSGWAIKSLPLLFTRDTFGLSMLALRVGLPNVIFLIIFLPFIRQKIGLCVCQYLCWTSKILECVHSFFASLGLIEVGLIMID